MAFLLLTGCAEQPVPLIQTNTSPDAGVDRLYVAEDGSIQHDLTTLSAALNVSDRIVIIDFWAEWCAPCRMLAPELETVAREMGDRVMIVKLDVDRHREVSDFFRVSSIPDLRFFRNGQPIGGLTSFREAAEIISRLESMP